MKKIILFGGVVGVAISAMLAMVMLSQASRPAPRGIVELPRDLPVHGKPDAPIEILVIEDLKCPICKVFHGSVQPELQRWARLDPRIKVSTLIWPFLSKARGLDDDDSARGAAAAICVHSQLGSSGFERYVSEAYAVQGHEDEAWLTSSKVREIAGKVPGLKADLFESCMSGDPVRRRLASWTAAVDASPINGTPTVLVQREIVADSRGHESSAPRDIKRAVDAALSSLP